MNNQIQNEKLSGISDTQLNNLNQFHVMLDGELTRFNMADIALLLACADSGTVTPDHAAYRIAEYAASADIITQQIWVQSRKSYGLSQKGHELFKHLFGTVEVRAAFALLTPKFEKTVLTR